MSPLALLLEGGASGPKLRRLGLLLAGLTLAWTALIAALGLVIVAIYLVLAMWLATYAAVGLTAVATAGVACTVIYWPRKRGEAPTEEIGTQLFKQYTVQMLVGSFAVGFALSASRDIRQIVLREVTGLLFKAV